jgi:hypothetical protein
MLYPPSFNLAALRYQLDPYILRVTGTSPEIMSPREVFMLRVTITCLLAAGAIAGCANLKAPDWASGYCSIGSNRSCPELEGDGTCQPCQVSDMTNGRMHFSANTLAQRLP